MPEQHADAQRHLQQVRIDKILLVHHNMPLMLAGNLLGSLPLAMILWHGSHDVTPLGWIAAIYLLTLARWLHYRGLDEHDDTPARILAQGRGYVAFAFVSGCIWGSSGILFFDPADKGKFIFLFLTLFAMTSGSMTSLSARPLNYLAYAIPTMLPITVNLFLQEEAFFYWMGVAALVYLSLTLMLSRNLHRSVDQSLNLKYENQELLGDLQRQTEATQQADRDKTRFLAAASHDLRQPLHAVNLFVEALEAKLTTEAQRYDLERIRLGLDSLGELLDALLNISRMDAGSMPTNRADFPIDQLLQRLAVQFAPDAEAKGLELNVAHCGRIVHSDPVLLERMIRNLLFNAICYTQRGHVRIVCRDAGEHHLRISVIDTGPGIPEARFEDVFTEFFQLHNPERDRSKGLGLGLAIVRRLSRLLDHPVELRSVPGQGSEFTVQVPVSHDIAVADDRKETETADYLHRLRVMVVDNEVEILDAMRALLEGWQCRFTGAASTREALRHIDAGLRPDFVISDYCMPGDMNGCELIIRLREELGPLPALLISGDTGAEIVRQAKEAGLILLTKPVKPAQLRLAMTRLVKSDTG